MTTSTIDTPTQWIKRHAHPLTTLDPDKPLTDLEPLRDMAPNARLVVLGVSARDTHELAGASHRILRFLVEELGFRSLAVEGDDATSTLLDEYVRTGAGDPQTLLANARSFWRTRELLDAVSWLHRHNQQHPADDAAYHLSGGSLAEWFDVIVHCQEVTHAGLFNRTSATA